MKREFLVQNPRPDGYHLMMELYGCDQEKINRLSSGGPRFFRQIEIFY